MYSMTKRDVQKMKVFKAEMRYRASLMVGNRERAKSLEHAKAIMESMVEKIHGRKPMVLVVEKMPHRKKALRRGCSPGRTWADTIGNVVWGRIRLSHGDGIPMTTLCHEVAHLLTPGEKHSPRFVRTHIQLVREFIGPHAAGDLVRFYQIEGVKIND